MERIDLFDRYLKNQLSKEELADFNNNLHSDEKFAEEFELYLLAVDGICREARENDLELGTALKSMSQAELMAAIGKKIEPKARKSFKIKSWVWQTAGCAAILLIAFLFSLQTERNARMSMDNAIYSMIDLDNYKTRSAFKDISLIGDEELSDYLPTLEREYHAADNDEDIADNGTILGLAYLRLHERKEAIQIFNSLVARFEDNPEYSEDVKLWKNILKNIEN